METTEAQPTLSKAELIAQGDAICAEVNAAVGTLGASEAEAADQVSQTADLYGGMVERLKALGTPDDTEGYEEFADAADELAQAKSDAELASAAGRRRSPGRRAEEDVSSALAAFQEAARLLRLRRLRRSAERARSDGAAAAPATKKRSRAGRSGARRSRARRSRPRRSAPETGGAGGGTGGGTGHPRRRRRRRGGSGGIGPG